MTISFRKDSAVDEYLSTRDLARRWGYHPGSLKNLRSAGRGPAYLVINGRTVRYALHAVQDFERRMTTADSR